MNKFKHIFGPVPSRRLGRSLGIDLVPFKICSYDCLYCQLGRTTKKTIKREDFVPLAEVTEELKQKLSESKEIDYISFSGSGEPTLNSGIGSLIAKVKALTKIPVAVLTNGSLLFDKAVQDCLLEADLVLPSLDAGTESAFKKINCPHPELDFARMVEGLISFRKRFKGRIWLEVFLLAGINDSEEEVTRIKELIEKINPDKVQLNTAARPTSFNNVFPLAREHLEEACQFLGKKAEIISYPKEKSISPNISCASILALLKRRPCTLEEIAHLTGTSQLEVRKEINRLREKGEIQEKHQADKTYFARKEGDL